MSRRIKERQLKAPIISIIGEGATERFYFTHLKLLRGFNYVCKPRNFVEHSFEEMQRHIEKVLDDQRIAVCVFDDDVTRIHPAEKRKLDAMRKKYADNPSVLLCDSMPSIEFWFLLHFLRTNRYFASSDDVAESLRKFLPMFSKKQACLVRDNWVSELLREERLNTAITNARIIGDGGESYSNIYLLFDRLNHE